MMIEIKQLTDVKFEMIHDAFKRAFADYVEPFDLTVDQLRYMVERRGFNPNLSFGAFDSDALVGITLNGIGEWNGKLTAYDTGTGIVKEYRKKGIATQMFTDSLPVLRENEIECYLLEVIKSNTSAYELYKKAGFKVVREFDYYKSEIAKLNLDVKKVEDGVEVKEIIIPDWDQLKSFWEFKPSWQNSLDSLNRKASHFNYLGIYKNNSLCGYGVIEPATGDIPQFAIAKNCRREGLATILFKHLVSLSENGAIKIINTEEGYEPFRQFAESINLPLGLGQYEMILDL